MINSKRKIILLVLILVSVVLSSTITWVVKSKISNSDSTSASENTTRQNVNISSGQDNTSSATYNSSSNGLTLTSGTETFSGKTYSSTGEDESAVLIKDGAVLNLSNSIITKSGDTSSDGNSSFYGQNAAVLATNGSTITLKDSTIDASGRGSNGAFATGQDSTVNLENVDITAKGGGAHGVMATQGGVMTLTNVNIITTDSNSGAIATDRGGGTITATGGVIIASGQDSPGIYSTGNIIVNDAEVSVTGAEAAVIEGGNSITLNNTDLSSSFLNKWGVMIYQSMSGDAEGTQGTFTMSGGSLSYTSTQGPLFYVTNSTGIINLTNVALNASSGVLVKASAGNWGTSGSNSGTVNLAGTNQTLNGLITADNISSVYLTLQIYSSFKGAINTDQSAKLTSLTLDSTSGWTVTEDSYLTILSNTDGISGSSITNITGNGHNVYYDSTNSENSYLNGETYSLQDGGKLMPI